MKVTLSKKMRYYQTRFEGHRRISPRFFMKRPHYDLADVIEISPAAREAYASEHKGPHKAEIVPWSSPVDIIDLAWMVQENADDDAARQAKKAEEIKAQVRQGVYDFNEPDRIVSATEMLMPFLK